MPLFIWFLIFVVILAILFPKDGRRQVVNSMSTTVGVCNYAYEQSVAKNANIDKVMDLLEEKEELTNHDIRDALNVSSRSVVRYMDRLEKENKVKQVGDTGSGVVYRKV